MKLATVPTGQANRKKPFGLRLLDTEQDILGVAACGNPKRHIALLSQRLNLALENMVKTVIIADSCQDRGVCCERDGRYPTLFLLIPPQNLRRQMLAAAGCAAVPEKKHLMAILK